MRCKCCNAMETTRWQGDDYCAKCKNSIDSELQAIRDDREVEPIGGDYWIVHTEYDDGDWVLGDDEDWEFAHYPLEEENE
jgi:hypothetical protein